MNEILSLQAQQIESSEAKASNWSWTGCAGGHDTSEASLMFCA